MAAHSIRKLLLLYMLIAILLSACSTAYINEQDFRRLEYGMKPAHVGRIIGQHGILEKLETKGSNQYKCISYYINHKDYTQLSLAYLNEKLTGSNLGGDCEDKHFLNSNLIELHRALDDWAYLEKERSVTVDKLFIAPFFLMAQLGTRKDEEFLNLHIGLKLSKILSDFGEPHCKLTTEDQVQVIGYDTVRGFTKIGYTLYFFNEKLIKIERSPSCTFYKEI
ncbi:hypothetical protein VT99_11872 [Candidatus Electrothrix marina]|uniref:Lipoprotein n=1 Tax=Candidatus Electrothrix marina TaxID=1859130 RepID=A0A3S3SP50_9BACT|nr:hypothetical protein VT99_11872 [Candidatus Electrothrix marina]